MTDSKPRRSARLKGKTTACFGNESSSESSDELSDLTDSRSSDGTSSATSDASSDASSEESIFDSNAEYLPLPCKRVRLSEESTESRGTERGSVLLSDETAPRVDKAVQDSITQARAGLLLFAESAQTLEKAFEARDDRIERQEGRIGALQSEVTEAQSAWRIWQNRARKRQAEQDAWRLQEGRARKRDTEQQGRIRELEARLSSIQTASSRQAKEAEVRETYLQNLWHRLQKAETVRDFYKSGMEETAQKLAKVRELITGS